MAATNQLSEIEVRKEQPFVSQVKKDFYLWYVEKNGNGGDRKEVGEETTTMWSRVNQDLRIRTSFQLIIYTTAPGSDSWTFKSRDTLIAESDSWWQSSLYATVEGMTTTNDGQTMVKRW